ncbi:MAG: S46 family peptidase, partial [Myxococcota bacterium]
YRAYVGKDGQPADYSPENVPLRPKHWLKVATVPLRKGDLVMVAGYPGRTNRHRTAAEVKDAVEWSYPQRIARAEEALQVLRVVAKSDAQAAVKASPWIFGIENSLKNARGMMDGLVKGGLAGQKEELENRLMAWITSDSARQAKYGQVLAEMAALDVEYKKNRQRDSDMTGIFFSSMLNTATTLVRMAEERPKADADRDPQFQERNWKRMRGRQQSMSRRYNQTLDKAMLTLALRRAARRPELNRDWLSLLVGDSFDDAAITRAVDQLYEATTLEDAAIRLKLLDTATTAELASSSDPFVQVAVKLRPLLKELEERSKRYDGAMTLLKPRYIEALREYSKGGLYPDANGTLRITYGTVRGYKPRPDADMYEPFTVLPG